MPGWASADMTATPSENLNSIAIAKINEFKSFQLIELKQNCERRFLHLVCGGGEDCEVRFVLVVSSSKLF